MRADVRVRREGRVAVVSLVPRAAAEAEATETGTRSTLIETIRSSKFVVVDLSGLDGIDASDVGLLVTARKAHRARWGTHMHLFKAVAPAGPVRALIESMHMEHILATYRSLPEALATFPRRRALLLEPDDETAATVEILLEANGFEVLRRRTPEEAADRPAADEGGRPDLVLAEIAFDGRVDRDLPWRLRLEHGAPVGVLTDRRHLEEGRIDGAAFALPKPVDPAAFLARLHTALESPLHEYYDAILDAVPTPVLVASVTGEVLHSNGAWRRLVGRGADESPRTISDSLGAFPAAAEVLRAAAAVGRAGGTEAVETTYAGPDGAPRRLRFDVRSVGPVGVEARVLVTAVVLSGAPPSASETDDPAAVRDVLLSLVEDLDAARVELARANERLETLDRLKSDFLSTVSHELRTPITAIKGWVENLLDGYLGEVDGRQRRSLEIVARNADRLARLIENLLQLSRIERGDLGLHRLRIDLREPVRAAVHDVQPIVERHGIRVDVEVPSEAFAVEADIDRTTQVVVNLLDNALRFARRRVRVALDRRGGEARLVVEDDGPGIPTADLERIFDRFHRSHASTAQSRTGLGLSIVRAIVEGQGGTVYAENRPSAEGGGARFVVLLPLAAASAPASAPAVEPALVARAG